MNYLNIGNLAKNLQRVLYENRLEKKIVGELRLKLKIHGFSSKDILDVLNGKNNLEDFPMQELALISQIVSRHFPNNLLLNPNNYFRPQELKASQYYSRSKNDEYLNLPLVVNKAIKICDDEYLFTLPILVISQMLNSGIITDNLNTQITASNLERVKNKIIQVSDYKNKKIDVIASLMVSGEYLSNPLIFNILFNEESRQKIIFTDSTLIINKGTQLDIIDGLSDILAIQKALEFNPNLNFSLPIILKNFGLTKVKKHLKQSCTVN